MKPRCKLFHRWIRAWGNTNFNYWKCSKCGEIKETLT